VLGTYGTWGLIGLNTAIFATGQLFNQRREEERLQKIEDLIRKGGGTPDWSEAAANRNEHAALDSIALTNCIGTVNDHGDPVEFGNDQLSIQSISENDTELAADPTESSTSDSIAVTNCDGAVNDNDDPVELGVNQPSLQSVSKNNTELTGVLTVPSVLSQLPPHFLPVQEHFHWPSALVGAVSGIVGLCLIVSMGK